MKIRYYLDPRSGQPHIEEHGITEMEVVDVLSRAGEDRPGRDDSRVAIGCTRDGRYLKVIYVPDSKADSVFVITAYDLGGKALKAYRRRNRRRKK
jgi:hypothetical protein